MAVGLGPVMLANTSVLYRGNCYNVRSAVFQALSAPLRADVKYPHGSTVFGTEARGNLPSRLNQCLFLDQHG